MICKGRRVSSHTHSYNELNNYANQNNPNSGEYQASKNNHANQMNPNNDEYKGK